MHDSGRATARREIFAGSVHRMRQPCSRQCDRRGDKDWVDVGSVYEVRLEEGTPGEGSTAPATTTSCGSARVK